MTSLASEFEIGFWHPFGPHAGETAEEIIERKRGEITRNGWTLWSFQFRNTLGEWFEEINKSGAENVLVFCSEGKGATDPKSETKFCSRYTLVNETVPREMPSEIDVPHPMGQKTRGSAFIVKNIIFPVDFERMPIVWLKNGEWQQAKLPTRPEYLIKPGDGELMPKPRSILELQFPYLAQVE